MKGYPIFCVLKTPDFREKFFIYKERKEDKISMFKRLLLVGMLAVMLVSPGFSAAFSCNGTSCIIEGTDESYEPKNTQTCIGDTLGQYSGNVKLKAVWRALDYRCGSGYYLNVNVTNDSASCSECPSGYYCGGFDDTPYDEILVNLDTIKEVNKQGQEIEKEGYGFNKCPENYSESESGAGTNTSCYTRLSVSCDKKNPYKYGNGTAVYQNTTVCCFRLYVCKRYG